VTPPLSQDWGLNNVLLQAPRRVFAYVSSQRRKPSYARRPNARGMKLLSGYGLSRCGVYWQWYTTCRTVRQRDHPQLDILPLLASLIPVCSKTSGHPFAVLRVFCYMPVSRTRSQVSPHSLKLYELLLFPLIDLRNPSCGSLGFTIFFFRNKPTAKFYPRTYTPIPIQTFSPPPLSFSWSRTPSPIFLF